MLCRRTVALLALTLAVSLLLPASSGFDVPDRGLRNSIILRDVSDSLSRLKSPANLFDLFGSQLGQVTAFAADSRSVNVPIRLVFNGRAPAQIIEPVVVSSVLFMLLLYVFCVVNQVHILLNAPVLIASFTRRFISQTVR